MLRLRWLAQWSQHECVQASYVAVGRNFYDPEDFIEFKYRKLKSPPNCFSFLFFLDNAALVVTTVAVMEIC